MKLAVQSIIWGPLLRELDRVLDDIADLGFAGIELSQHPSALGDGSLTIDGLLRKCESRDLQLIGLAGGTIQARVDFCQDFRPSYLYTENWFDQSKLPKQPIPEFTLAIHPHVSSRIHRIAQVRELLDKHKALKFIPDTAHVFMSGDDVCAAIRELFGRIAAVHLKDWTPDYGISPFHYAQGFVSFGAGTIQLAKVVDVLQSLQFDGWVVIEQDSTAEMSPRSALEHSVRWLSDNTPIQLRTKVSRPTRPPPPNGARPPFSTNSGLPVASTNSLGMCLKHIVQHFHAILDAHTTTLWSYSASVESMGLLAATPNRRIQARRIDVTKCLCQDAIVSKYVKIFPLCDPAIRSRFADPTFLEDYNVTEMSLVCIPIANPWNPNHIWCVVNCITEGGTSITCDSLILFHARDAALALSAAIDRECQVAVRRTQRVLGEQYPPDNRRGLNTVTSALSTLIGDILHCEAVSIFLVDQYRTRLCLSDSTTTVCWADERRQYYLKGQGRTGKVWELNEPLIQTAHDRAVPVPSSMELITRSDIFEGLFAPIRHPTSGEVLGVIRCRNRLPSCKSSPEVFTELDIALLESVCSTSAPLLEMLQASDRRTTALTKLVHEIGNPLFALRGTVTELAADRIVSEAVKTRFGRHYLKDCRTWCDLLPRLLDRLELDRVIADNSLRLVVTKCDLVSDVIAPATRRVKHLIEQRGFRKWTINRDQVSKVVPRLIVDTALMQEVFFNLFENAIKYCFEDPESLQIYIAASHNNDSVLLHVSDYGQGIERADAAALFEEGIRGRLAANSSVTGQGLGLWFVKRIIEAHGGSVRFSSCARPTTVTIDLPRQLEFLPPNNALMEQERS